MVQNYSCYTRDFTVTQTSQSHCKGDAKQKHKVFLTVRRWKTGHSTTKEWTKARVLVPSLVSTSSPQTNSPQDSPVLCSLLYFLFGLPQGVLIHTKHNDTFCIVHSSPQTELCFVLARFLSWSKTFLHLFLLSIFAAFWRTEVIDEVVEAINRGYGG